MNMRDPQEAQTDIDTMLFWLQLAGYFCLGGTEGEEEGEEQAHANATNCKHEQRMGTDNDNPLFS